MPFSESLILEREHSYQNNQVVRKSEVEIDVIDITSSDSEEDHVADSEEDNLSVNLSNLSEEDFTENRDDLICWGELMKFKPGLTCNFISRYVQLSTRVFRYYKSKAGCESAFDAPLVSIRRRYIEEIRPIKVNKSAYLHKGSKIS